MDNTTLVAPHRTAIRFFHHSMLLPPLENDEYIFSVLSFCFAHTFCEYISHVCDTNTILVCFFHTSPLSCAGEMRCTKRIFGCIQCWMRCDLILNVWVFLRRISLRRNHVGHFKLTCESTKTISVEMSSTHSVGILLINFLFLNWNVFLSNSCCAFNRYQTNRNEYTPSISICWPWIKVVFFSFLKCDAFNLYC